MTTALTHTDIALLRAAIAVAERSRAHGNHPFGAVLVASDGTVLAEAENTVVTERDATGHAETNLARIAAKNFDRADLRRSTLYSSTEPCAMCSGAIYWTGIGRVVYALAETDLLALTANHHDNPTLALPCREVFARGQTPVTVVGPALQDEAARPHEGFWSPDPAGRSAPA